MDTDNRLALQDYVAGALRKATRGVRTREDFDSAREALMNVVNCGMAEVAVDWNLQFSPTLCALPAEVLVRCFRHLESQSRVRVACVSHAWRAVAFSDPELWADFDAVVRSMTHLDLLQSVMRRSASLPLDLSVQTFSDVEQGISAAIREHMHRIRNLNIAGTLTLSLDGANAALLKNLTADCVILPCAPHLQELRAFEAHLTDLNLQYPELRSFSGDIKAEDFFGACPNLERLEPVLPGHKYSTDISHWPRGSPPAALTYIKLTSFATQSDNYLITFQECRALREIDLIGPWLFTSLVEFFSSTGFPLRKISLDRGRALLESDSSPGLTIRLNSEGYSSSPFGPLTLPTLRELTVSRWGATFRRSEDISCPALERLTIQATSTELRDESRRDAVMLNAPTLHTLVLLYKPDRYTKRRDKFVRILVKYLPSLLRRLSTPLVHALVITGPDFNASQIDKVSLADIRDYVHHIYHDDRELEIPQ